MSIVMRKSVRVILWLAFVLLFPAITTAQTYRGTIKGEVADADLDLIGGASVIATNKATGQSREVVTSEDGNYVIPELPAGEYEVQAKAEGFNEGAFNVTVNIGGEIFVNFILKPATVKAEVVVRSNQGIGSESSLGTPVVDTGRVTLGAVVNNRLVVGLPLNGRDFTKLVALTPGVTVEPSGVAGTEKGAGQFNINGNRDRSNNYTLDGTDNNDPFFNNSATNQVGITGAPASLLPIEAIQEFNIQAHFAAEYGRNSGSVVNVLTKSGTNELHGSVFEFLRNDKFDARNFFNRKPNPQTAFRNNNFGASLGGPVIRGRTFFFGAYEGQRERVASNVSLVVPTVQQRASARQVALNNGINSINPSLERILDNFPVSSTGFAPGVTANKNDLDNFIVKLDHSFNPTNTLSGRYAFSRSQQRFPQGSLGGFGSGSRLAQFAQESPTRVQVLSLSYLKVFSSTLVNETRAGFSRYRTSFASRDRNFDPASIGLNFGTGERGLPEFDFSGLIENLGITAFGIPRGRISQTYQVLDNLTWLQGKHTFKFGGEYRRASVNGFNNNLGRGLFSFSPSGLDGDPVVDVLANFYLGNAFVLGNTGDTQRTTFNNGASFFAQDDFRIRRNVTLNLGLRWEYFGPLTEERDRLSNFTAPGQLSLIGSNGLNSVYRRDLNNFAPRLGLAWDIFGNERLVLRTAYGVYYDFVPQHLFIANFTPTAGVATNPIGPSPVFPLNYNQSAFLGGGGAILSAATTGPFNIFITDRKFVSPYTQNFNFNLQTTIRPGFGVEVGYVGSKGTKLVRLYDQNQPDIFGNRPNPNFSFVDVLSSSSNSTYHGMQMIVKLQGVRGFSGLVSYTVSKSLDDASDGIDFNFASAALPQDSTNLRAEHGPSVFDTRQRFTAALNYQLPTIKFLPGRLGTGWQVDTIIFAQTGRPIPIVTSNDTSAFPNNNFNTRSNFHQRPNLVPGVNPILPNFTPETGYLNPLAFQQPADGSFGSLGRNQIFGPGLSSVDFSIVKTTPLTEKVRLEFRTEIFNIFNHPNFALPSGTITPGINADGSINFNAGPAGVITQTPDVAQGNPSLGGGGPRVIQFGLRLLF
ncbi:MAG: TonB-dependent receptor [Acidobacteriota bacterium]